MRFYLNSIMRGGGEDEDESLVDKAIDADINEISNLNGSTILADATNNSIDVTDSDGDLVEKEFNEQLETQPTKEETVEPEMPGVKKEEIDNDPLKEVLDSETPVEADDPSGRIFNSDSPIEQEGISLSKFETPPNKNSSDITPSEKEISSGDDPIQQILEDTEECPELNKLIKNESECIKEEEITKEIESDCGKDLIDDELINKVKKLIDKNCDGEIDILKNEGWDINEVSKVKTFTIREGTILYCGSKKALFNPYDIKLNANDEIHFFSDSLDHANARIESCSKYPNPGYIHKFKVKHDIRNIIILSPYELEEGTMVKNIEKNFCARNNKYDMNVSGVGFFFPHPITKVIREFTLCDPREYLEYIDTQGCIAAYKLGPNYSFNK
jgi:hypothetical protein